MRVIVVGNGLAGTIFSKTLRELDPKAEIDIFAREKYLYYPRPNLIEFLAGNIPQEKLFAFPEEWYASQKISVHLDRPAIKLHPEAKQLEIDGGKKEKYDALLLANGANSFIPPFAGTEKKGVFALRSLDDSLAIIEWIRDHTQVVVIGGGLLGLEIARAIHSRGVEVVRVAEFFDRLLPRQLDSQGASVLQSQIEDLGIKIHVGVSTEEIQGQGEVRGLRLKGGEELKANTAIVAAGVRPNLGLAAEAGLRTDKGVMVNDFLQTSGPGIYAAGDNVQHNGRIYGIIPATFNQARIVALNINGQQREYAGTIPSNTLKVVGLDLTSIGTVNPEAGTCEEYRKEIKERGVYKKIVIQNGRVIGAIWMGTKERVNDINRIIFQQIDIEKWKKQLLEDNFDFSVL
jgi:nitrite reductase (NADH) large subunit